MAGRKRIPDHLKVVSGTAQKCRTNPDAPPTVSGLAKAPEYLSETAAEIYDQLGAIITGMGIASPDDVFALAMLAQRLEEIRIYSTVIEDGGHAYVTNKKTGRRGAVPEVAMRNEAMRHAQSLMSEFGLTPAARSKVSAIKAPKANSFAAFGK